MKNIKTRERKREREREQRNDVTKNIQIFDFNGVNVAKALACGGARYLPSLIALLNMYVYINIIV